MKCLDVSNSPQALQTTFTFILDLLKNPREKHNPQKVLKKGPKKHLNQVMELDYLKEPCHSCSLTNQMKTQWAFGDDLGFKDTTSRAIYVPSRLLEICETSNQNIAKQETKQQKPITKKQTTPEENPPKTSQARLESPKLAPCSSLSGLGIYVAFCAPCGTYH